MILRAQWTKSGRIAAYRIQFIYRIYGFCHLLTWIIDGKADQNSTWLSRSLSSHHLCFLKLNSYLFIVVLIMVFPRFISRFCSRSVPFWRIQTRTTPWSQKSLIRTRQIDPSTSKLLGAGPRSMLWVSICWLWRIIEPQLCRKDVCVPSSYCIMDKCRIERVI